MKHAYSEKVIVRRDVKSADGLAQLSLRVIINQKKKELNLWFRVPPTNFDERGQRVHWSAQKEKSNIANVLISKAKSKAHEIFTNAILTEKELTVISFTEQFSNAAARTDFLAWMEKEIGKAQDERAHKTICSYNATWRKLKMFRSEISFAEISLEMIQDFNRWLIKEHRLEPNTLGRHHKNLKKFIGVALKRGMKMANPYLLFRLPSARTERDWLTLPEFQKIIDLYKDSELSPELGRILRHWLFMASTSLRWSDFSELREGAVFEEYLDIRPQKTRNSLMRLKVPLCDFAKKLIDDARLHERGTNNRIFQTTSDQNENRYLKQAAQLAGIHKNLTTVVARHSFATTFLSLGGKVEVLQRIMGHSKIETTMVYVHILGEQKFAQVKNFDIAFKL